MAWKREDMMTGHVAITNADRLRYESDPKALAWAHEQLVEEALSAWKLGEQQPDSGWKKYANILAMRMIGTGGCVVAAFDARLAKADEALARFRYEIRQERNPDGPAQG